MAKITSSEAKDTEMKVPAEEDKDLKGTAAKSDELLAQALAKMEEQQKVIEQMQKQLAEAQKQSAGSGPIKRKTDREIVREADEKAIQDGVDPWTVKVPVRSRPRTGTTEKHYWLGVNGRFMALPADDHYYDLPLPFAQALVKAMDAENFVKDYADKNIKVYDLINNPHEEEDAR